MLTGLLDRISRTMQRPALQPKPIEVMQAYDLDTYSLADASQIFATMPAMNCFLGVCEDGYPMLIELEQSANGTILVVSDDPQGRTDLAQVMVASSLAANPASQFKYSVIYSDEGAWKSFLEDPQNTQHLLAKIGSSHTKAGDWILQLALLAEERSFGRRLGANTLLILDEADFLQNADANVRNNFVWLCQYGPQFGIRPLISLSSEAALEMPELIQHIRTRIYGRMPNRAAFHLSAFSGLDTEDFEEDRQFIVRSENNWIHFWTPN